MFAIKIIGIAGLAPDPPDIRPEEDYWVMAYDPDAHEGRGEVQTTHDPALALHFNDSVSAWMTWKQQSKRLPLRADGRPNRPLTAFCISVEEVSDAVSGHTG